MRELLARIANFLVRFKTKIFHFETWDSLVAESDLQPRFNCIYAASILLNRNPKDYLLLGMSSQSQLYQDVVALMVANRKTNGYFVEFGASFLPAPYWIRILEEGRLAGNPVLRKMKTGVRNKRRIRNHNEGVVLAH